MTRSKWTHSLLIMLAVLFLQGNAQAATFDLGGIVNNVSYGIGPSAEPGNSQPFSGEFSAELTTYDNTDFIDASVTLRTGGINLTYFFDKIETVWEGDIVAQTLSAHPVNSLFTLFTDISANTVSFLLKAPMIGLPVTAWYEGTVTYLWEREPTPSPTPIPGAIWLLGSGLAGLLGLRRMRKA